MWHGKVRITCAWALATAVLMAAGPGTADAGDVQGAQANGHASLVAYPDALVVAMERATGLLAYVEGDGRTVVAFSNDGRVLWRWSMPRPRPHVPAPVGTPVVRHLAWSDDGLRLTVGKATVFVLDRITGHGRLLGSD